MKRLFDLILATILITVLSMPMLFIILAIRLTSKGPALYWSERIGFNNLTYKMPKFRSMRIDTPQVATHLMSNPEKFLSPIGGFLRRTSLDELPQLISIIKGDMSFVGPRPERPIFVDNFKKNVPHYMLRLKMKAGLTGWAQINGWRGNTSLEKRIEYDLYYIKHWSLWFDLKIIVMTIWRGILNRHA